MPATTAYAPGTAYDEAFDADGVPRPHCASLVEELARLGREDLAARRALVDAAYMRQGTTFTVYGEEAGGERPFPLDLVPRIVAAAEWAELERGLRQRVEALDAFLADVYGPQRILRDRVVPRDLVLRSPGFRAEAAGIAPPGGTYIHVCGTDLIRDRAGIWRVLEDNTRVPSGISYVLENRLVLKRVLPSLFGAHAVRPVDHYPAAFLQALRSLAPPGRDDPVVVLLTPGPYSSAYFEHAFLAKQLGVPLVEGRDLAAHDNRLWMRTTRGLARVDVVYRRIDDDFLDPLAFRADSVLGVPGLANAARAGNVALANAIGTGAADDKAVYPFVPAMIRYYLAEEPLLAQVETFRGAEPSHLSHMLAHADELVIKATDGAGGAGMLIGPQASAGERTSYLERVRARPAGYVAQPLIDLSTCPCLVDGRLEPRHVDLRPFIVRGHDETTIIPGGLTRVALRRGSVVVNSSQGGGSKDTWVLADEIPAPPAARDDVAIEPLATRAAASEPMLIRHADACFWLGRYAERVEATARAIDTVYHVRLERPFADDVLGWDSILAIYGHEAHGPADERAVLHRLVFDEDNPGSIRSGMRAARENARGVRDLISSEMWEALNEAYLDIEAWDVDRVLRRSPHAFFRRVRNELRLFDGITGRTMVRDEGREFLAAGRHLERAAQTARILDIKYHHLLPATALSVAGDARGIGGEVDLQGWAAVLRSVGAYEAYVSRHGSEISTSLVAGFLVLDAGFPASVVHSVRRIDVALRRISRNWDPRPASEAERLTGRLLGDLVFTDGRELVDAGLHEFLIDVIARCDAVGQAIADEFLPA